MGAAMLATRLLVAILAGAGCAAALADDGDDDADSAPHAIVALAATPIAPQHLNRVDTPADAQHSQPGYRNELSELDYRWWASSGRADLGFGIGTLAYVA